MGFGGWGGEGVRAEGWRWRGAGRKWLEGWMVEAEGWELDSGGEEGKVLKSEGRGRSMEEEWVGRP